MPVGASRCTHWFGFSTGSCLPCLSTDSNDKCFWESKSCRNNTYCCSDKRLFSQGGGGDEHTWSIHRFICLFILIVYDIYSILFNPVWPALFRRRAAAVPNARASSPAVYLQCAVPCSNPCVSMLARLLRSRAPIRPMLSRLFPSYHQLTAGTLCSHTSHNE